jgi:HK97 family phage prohead protease
MLKLISTDLTLDAAAIEGMPSRSVSGVAVPYGVAATVSDGTKVIFEQGSLPTDGKAPKLYLNHDSEQAVGIVTERVETTEGMMFSARISKTPQGDTALTLALDQVIDSVSVGVNPTKFKITDDGTMLVQAADWLELSLVTGRPAFSGAVITDVMATEPETETETIPHEDEEKDIIQSEVTQQETENMNEATPVEAAIPTSPVVFAEAKREFKMPSAGEYLAAMHIGGDTYRKVNAAYHEAARRGQSAIEAVSQDLTSDTPGLLPVPVLGPVFQNINLQYRPVVAAFGTRAMPQGSGISFTRPVISQHTAAGVQSTQGTAVTSQTMTLSASTVSRQTVAGSIQIAQQTMDFTDPAAMNVILNDLAGQYLKQTDNIAADYLVAQKQASGYTWTVTAGDVSTLITGIYGCAENISATTNLFPTHLVVSVDVWRKLGSQVDDVNRPVFPAIGAPGLLGMNTLGAGSAASWSGMNPLGLEIVVDGNLASGTMLVVHGPAVEYYEAQQGMRSVEVPDLLARTFSYYGYFATFAQDGPNPSAVAGSQFIQAITVA